MQAFWDFLRRYSSIWLLLLGVYVLGNIFPALALPPVLIYGIYNLRKGKHQHVILLVLILAILGDSRQNTLQFVKPLRIIMILLLLVQTISDLSRKRYPFRKLTWVIIPFFLLSILVAFRNPSPALSLSKGVSYSFLLFIAIHYFNYHIRQKGRDLLRDVIMLAGLVCFLGLFFRFANPGLAMFEESGRFRGMFGNPNGMGVYGTLMFPLFFLYFRLSPHNLSKRLSTALWAALLISIFISFSRNAITTVLIFLFLRRIHKSGRVLPFLFYGFLVPIMYFLLQPENLIAILEMIGLAEELRADTLLTGSGRVFAWQWALEEFAKSPLVGRGFAYEEILFHDYMPEWLYATGHQGGVHNSYLSFMLNTGIIGLINVLSFFLALSRWVRPSYYRPAILVAAGFSAFFEPWLNSSLNAFTVHFLLVLLFYANYYRIVKPSLQSS